MGRLPTVERAVVGVARRASVTADSPNLRPNARNARQSGAMRLCHDGRPSAPSAKLAVMEVTFVKASEPGEQHRVYLTMDGAVRREPVHVVHDLPHLVVESVFGIGDGTVGRAQGEPPRCCRPGGDGSRPQAPEDWSDRLGSRSGCIHVSVVDCGAQAGQGPHQCRSESLRRWPQHSNRSA